MPAITIMYWNIQDLGTDSRWRRGDFTPICNFIAGFARQLNVDVFCLIESRESFVPYLGVLQTAFNTAYATANPAPAPPTPGDWRFDWIPGAVAGDINTRFKLDDAEVVEQRRKMTRGYQARPNQPAIPQNFNQLAYTETAHYEGYVVFWNSLCANFQMIDRPTGPSGGVGTGLLGNHGAARHSIDLVYEGRQIWGWEEVLNAQHQHYLVSARAYEEEFGEDNDWATLNFCMRASVDGMWCAVRRPAACTLVVNGIAGNPPADQRLLSIVMGHCPSRESGGAFGSTNRMALGREMYNARDLNDFWKPAKWVVAGADFNVSTQHELRYVYDAFTDNYEGGIYDGAQCVQFVPSRMGAANDTLSKSIVRLNKQGPNVKGRRTWVPIVPSPGNPDSNTLYRAYAVDNVFTRGFAAVAPQQADYEVYNLIAELQTAGSATMQLVQAIFLPYLQNINAARWHAPALRPTYRGRPIFPNIRDYPSLMTQLTNGVFTSPRSTAEFVNTFLSDHLPVVVTVTT